MTGTEEKYTDHIFEQITINYCDRLVQIARNNALKNYLEAPGNGALKLQLLTYWRNIKNAGNPN